MGEDAWDKGEDSLTLRELIAKIKWAEPSCQPLCGDLANVWCTERDTNYRTGDETETSYHISRVATPREKRIWGWALKHLFAKK